MKSDNGRRESISFFESISDGHPTYFPEEESPKTYKLGKATTSQYYEDKMELSHISDDSLSGTTYKKTQIEENSPSRKNTRRSKCIVTETEDEYSMTSGSMMEEVPLSYSVLSVTELHACIHEELKSAEEGQKKSKNIKGKLQGQLKRSINKTKEITTELVRRLGEKGDVDFLRTEKAKEIARNMELTTERDAVMSEVAILKVTINDRNAKIRALRDIQTSSVSLGTRGSPY